MGTRELINIVKNTLRLFIVCATVVILCPPVSASTEKPADMTQPYKQNVALQKSIADQWGIEILSLRRTAANYMLDFRYRVLDAEKAKPLFKRKIVTYLFDQASGAKFAVPSSPKTGPLRNSNVPQQGRNYFTFFANPGQYVKAGNNVTVVIGDLRAENMIVE